MKVTREEAFTILELSQDADEVQVKTAFKKLALKYHPDKNGGCSDAAEKFKRISAAYARLTSDQQSDDELDDEAMHAYAAQMFDQLFGDLAFNMFMQDMLSGLPHGMHSRKARARGVRPGSSGRTSKGIPVRPPGGGVGGLRGMAGMPGVGMGGMGMGGMPPFMRAMGGMGGMGGMFGFDVRFDRGGYDDDEDDDEWEEDDSSEWETDEEGGAGQAGTTGRDDDSSEWETDDGTDDEAEGAQQEQQQQATPTISAPGHETQRPAEPSAAAAAGPGPGLAGAGQQEAAAKGGQQQAAAGRQQPRKFRVRR